MQIAVQVAAQARGIENELWHEQNVDRLYYAYLVDAGMIALADQQKRDVVLAVAESIAVRIDAALPVRRKGAPEFYSEARGRVLAAVETFQAELSAVLQPGGEQ